MEDPRTLLTNFYNSTTDRAQMWEQLKWEKENNPAFTGLDEKQIGKVINDATGAAPGSRWDVFDSKTRWIDAAGYYTREAFSGLPATPTDYLGALSGKGVTTMSDVGAYVGESAGITAGATGSDLDMWRDTGASLPGGLGTLALAAIPYVGTSAMLATSYGGSVNDALMGGATPGRAAAAGALDTGVNLLMLKAGGPIADKVSTGLLDFAVGQGTRAALADASGMVLKEGGKQITGRALTQLAVKKGAISAGQGLANRAISEGAAELAGIAVGVAGQIGHEGLLDYEGLKAHMSNPQYWASTLASEGVMSLLGVTLGNIREPNHLSDYEAVQAGSPLFSKSTTTQDDLKVPALSRNLLELTAERGLKQVLLTKSGTEAIEPLTSDAPTAIGLVANALITKGDLALNTNAAQAAAHMVATQPPYIIESLITGAIVRRDVTVPELPPTIKTFKPSHFQIELDVDGVEGPVLFSAKMAYLPKDEVLAGIPSPEAREAVGHVHDLVQQRFQEELGDLTPRLPSNFTPSQKLGYSSFLETSGLSEALRATNSKLIFFDLDSSKDWFEHFLGDSRDSMTGISNGTGSLLFVNAKDSNRMGELHELGHVMDHALSNGGYGTEHQAEWTRLKETFAGSDDPLTIPLDKTGNILGAAVGRELDGSSTLGTDDFRKYYATRSEWAAQAFHGYMLGKPTKFKTFIEQNFSKVHEVFTRVVDSIKSVFSPGKKVTKDSITSAWQPGQHEVQAFFESVFNSINKPDTEKEVLSMVKKYKLTPKATESFIEAVTSGKTLAGKAMSFEALRLWSKETNPIEQDLLDVFETVNLVNKSGMTLQDLMTPTVSGLPNVRRAMSVNPDSLRADMLLRLGTDAPVEARERVEKYIRNAEQVSMRGLRALQAIDYVLSNKVAMIEKEVGEQSLYDRGIQLLQVDHLLGKWLRGELPGQDGRFMWEPRFEEKGFGEIDVALKRERVHPDQVRERNQILFAKEFPTLSKAIKRVKTGERSQDWVKESPAKGSPRRIFDSKEAAAEYADLMNNDGNNFGQSFSPHSITKGAKGHKTEVWGVRATKDERKSIVASYRDDLATVTDALHVLQDEPDTLAYVQKTQEQLLRRNYYDNLETHLARVTRHVFAEYRNGKKHVFPEQMQQALKAFYQYLGHSSAFYKSMLEDLKPATTALEDVMLSMVKLASKSVKDKNDLLHLSPKPVVTLFENYKNYMKVWLEQDFTANLQAVYEGKLPFIDNNRTLWQNFEHGFSPLSDENYMDQIAVMQHATPGGILRKSASGTTYAGLSPRTLLGKTMAGIEKLHTYSFAGMQNIAETNKAFRELAIYIDQEEPTQNYLGNRVIRNFRGKGEMVTDANGERRWVATHGDERKDDRVYIAINSSKKLKPVVNRMQLMQNEAGGIKFADIASNNLAVGKGSDTASSTYAEDVKQRAELAKEANEMLSKNFDLNNPKHRAELQDIEEYLERTYAAQREIAAIVYERELDLHHLTTANAFFRGVDFTGTPEQARDLATKVMQFKGDVTTRENEIATLLMNPVANGGLGWDAHQALSFAQKHAAATEEILTMHNWMQSTPGYVKEQRMKRFHVAYTEPNSKSGKIGTGLRDFDTAEEAWAFIREAPSKGIKLADKRPQDTFEKNARLRTGTDLLDTVVSKVAQTRKDMLEFVLEPLVANGQMTPEQMQNSLNVLSGMAEDVSADMTTSRLRDILAGHRLFKSGREHLDMAYQQEESAWRTAIQYSRKHTDAGFQLFIDDERLSKFEMERERFRTGKDALRTADGKGQRMASKTAFSYFILGNFSSAMIEAAQWPLSLSHILVEEGSSVLDAFRIPSKFMARAGAASAARLLKGSDASIWEKPHLDLIRYAEESNRLGVRPLNDISTDNVEAKIELMRQAANPGAYSGVAPKMAWMARAAYSSMNNFYAFFSRINAELSLVSSYEVLRKKAYPNRQPNPTEQADLYEQAIRVANKANGSWGRGNRPWWFDTKNTTGRTVAQLAWSLQGFASNHVANHLRLLKNSIGHAELGLSKEEVTQSRKALAVMTTMQVAGLGVMGHTLAGGLSKLITATFGFDPESAMKEWLEDEDEESPEDRLALADLVTQGLFHQMDIPVDFQSRVSVSGLGPLSSYEGWNASSFGGPVLSTLGNLVDGWNTISKGDGSAESYMRWGVGLLPTGVQRALRMELFDDGKVFNKSGQFIMEPTTAEKLGAYLGFAPRSYSDYMKSKTKMIEANQMDGVERTQATQKIRSALVDGNHTEALRLLKSESVRLGLTTKELASRVAELEVTQTHGPGMTVGAGPNAQRAARLYESPLPQASEVAKQQTKFKTLQALQQMPIDWRKRMFEAQMVDTTMQLLPGQRPTQARQALRNPMVRSTVLQSLQADSSPRQVGLAGFASVFGQ